MKIYLDDERDLPAWMAEEGGWIVARTPREFVALIKNGLAEIEAISFDNDLGAGYTEGRHLLNRIECMVRIDGEPCPELFVHTANPAAGRSMYACIASLRQFDNARLAAVPQTQRKA